MAPHSNTLAWKIPWMEEPDGLQFMGSQRVGHDWATSLSLFTLMRWRRKWQPTPVFLPGESQGQRSLVGYRLWGCTELDSEATQQQQQQNLQILEGNLKQFELYSRVTRSPTKALLKVIRRKEIPTNWSLTHNAWWEIHTSHFTQKKCWHPNECLSTISPWPSGYP